jgi:type I restriction enzyme S subunit
MPDWVEKSLGSVFKVKHGFAFKGEYFTDSQQPHALVTPGNFSIGGGFQSQKQKYYNGPIPSEYVLDPGSVVVTMTDLSKQSDTLGYAALIPDDGITWLHNQRVGLLQFHDLDQADPVFVSYLMRTQAYRAWVVGSATGTTVKHTAPSRIESFRCLVPPVEEQRRIASVLKSLDDKIAVNRRINQTLEAMAQAIFKSWFVDFDPVKAKIAAKAEDRDPLRAAMTTISGKPDAELDTLHPDQFATLATTAALFPDEMEDSGLGEIPKGWQATPLDGIAIFLNGLALQKFPPESSTEFLPVIKIAQLRAGHTQGADRASKAIKPEYVVEDGDVLFSWSGSLEVDVWTGGPGALNQHLFKVTSEQYPRWFYLLATKHHLPVFREIAANKATTMGHIQRRHLSEALIAVAPNSLMSRATEVLAPIIGEMVALRLQARELAVTRDTLLPKLLSGELQAQHTEREVTA